jgi:hypothetical protein
MTSNLIVLVCTVTFLLSVKQQQKTNKIIPSAISIVDSLPGDDPYLTKNNKGEPVLSWVRRIDNKSSIFCYAVSKDEGKTFANTIVIPASDNIYAHAENMPKLIFKPSGEIIAVWGAKNPNPDNKYSGLIYYSQSFDDGKSWTNATKLVADTKGTDQRFSDVTLLQNGEVGIMWLDNRKNTDKEGSAVYFASTSGADGFKNERLISEPSCQCCRTSLFSDSKGNIHALYRGIINDSIRDMIHVVSTDGGETFSSPQNIYKDNWILRGCPHTGPAMTENKNGIHFAWFTGARSSGCFYTKTADNGNTFTGRDIVTKQGSHPQLSSFPGGEIALVWDETFETPDGYYKRIGLQVRDEKGSRIKQQFITPDSVYTTYPVISSFTYNTAVVAYCMKISNRNYIAYQTIAYK